VCPLNRIRTDLAHHSTHPGRTIPARGAHVLQSAGSAALQDQGASQVQAATGHPADAGLQPGLIDLIWTHFFTSTSNYRYFPKASVFAHFGLKNENWLLSKTTPTWNTHLSAIKSASTMSCYSFKL